MEMIIWDPFHDDYRARYEDLPFEAIQYDRLEQIIHDLSVAYADPFCQANSYFDRRYLDFIRHYLTTLSRTASDDLKRMMVWWYSNALDPAYLMNDSLLSSYKENQRPLLARGRLVLRLCRAVAAHMGEERWYDRTISTEIFEKLFQRFLEHENEDITYHQDVKGELPLAVRISKIINRYKHQFLTLYDHPVHNQDDIQENSSDLFELMRFSFGYINGDALLPIQCYVEESPLKQQLKSALKTFVRGGFVKNYHEKSDVIIPSFIPTLLITLLQKAIYNPHDRTLTTEDIETFIAHDEFLFAQHRHASLSEYEMNDYFDPFAEDLRPSAVGSEARLACYKPKIFEYMLKTYGYVIESKKSEGS